VEIFARLAAAPIAAITGSNGKSTVTALLGQMVSDAGKQVQVGGNIGTPVLDLLAEPVPDCYVLELSSFQLETTRSLAAQAAVVLNVSPDHLDRYDDLAHYAACKQVVYHNAAVSVVNRDDATVMAMAQGAAQVLSFGLDVPAENQFGRIQHNNETWLARGSEPLLPVSRLRMVGEHNQANALAALALGEALDLPMDSMLDTVQHFAGLPHRTQWVAELNGVAWYNDSKGTNVGATLSALKGLPGPLVLIAGGQGKGADFTSLRAAVADKVRAVVLVGEDAQQIALALHDAVPVVFANSMEDAVQQAQQLARPGDAVLLSPACASFDMFNGFEHRGEVFFAAVKALGSGGAA
jgi:UDP-N-acetylmuramoylalanine--D-glutamate ligase